jgi:hypothetical protein
MMNRGVVLVVHVVAVAAIAPVIAADPADGPDSPVGLRAAFGAVESPAARALDDWYRLVCFCYRLPRSVQAAPKYPLLTGTQFVTNAPRRGVALMLRPAFW